VADPKFKPGQGAAVSLFNWIIHVVAFYGVLDLVM
jgi:hypothetical protein